MLAVASVHPVSATSQLDEGILCIFLHWESSAIVRYSLPLLKEGRLRTLSIGYSLMSCCGNFFDDQHWGACICLWQLTGALLCMVSSIRIAHLLVHCVLIGSLAELLFSFHMRSVLAFLQMVDPINGKLMSSMVIVLALNVHCHT